MRSPRARQRATRDVVDALSTTVIQSVNKMSSPARSRRPGRDYRRQGVSHQSQDGQREEGLDLSTGRPPPEQPLTAGGLDEPEERADRQSRLLRRFGVAEMVGDDLVYGGFARRVGERRHLGVASPVAARG